MEYIGNLENCPVFKREDGSFLADMSFARITVPAKRGEPWFLPILDGMRRMITLWLCITILVFLTFLISIPQNEWEMLSNVKGWIVAISFLTVTAFGCSIILDTMRGVENAFLRVYGGISGGIVSILIFYLDAGTILQFNANTLTFIPHYVAVIVVLGVVKWVIALLWERKYGEYESPIQLRQYGWIGFPKITVPEPQSASETASDTAAAENTT